MITKYDLDFGSIFIFDTYVISIFNEGIVFKEQQNDQLLEISRRHFKNRPYGYISYRMFSYSVDPIIYRKTSEEHNLALIAVVSLNSSYRLSVEVEKLFYQKKLQHFDNIDSAKKWIKRSLKYKKAI